MLHALRHQSWKTRAHSPGRNRLPGVSKPAPNKTPGAIEAPLPLHPPADAQVHFKQLIGHPRFLSMEILRLFVLDRHTLPQYRTLDIDRETMAAIRFAGLDEPGTAAFFFQDKNHLSGLFSLGPELPLSSWLGRKFWSVKELSVESDVTPETICRLIGTACQRFPKEIDILTARVAATNGTVIRGLYESGFRFMGCEVTCALPCNQTDPWEPPSVRFVTFQSRHVPSATAIALGYCDSYRWLENLGLRRESLENLYKFLLTEQARDPHFPGLVAEGSSGNMLGFVTFARDLAKENHAGRPLASIGMFGMRPQARHAGLGEMLIRHALSSLVAKSVDVVIARTAMNGSDPDGNLRICRKVGGQSGNSVLIMCRRFNEPLK